MLPPPGTCGAADAFGPTAPERRRGDRLSGTLSGLWVVNGILRAFDQRPIRISRAAYESEVGYFVTCQDAKSRAFFLARVKPKAVGPTAGGAGG